MNTDSKIIYNTSKNNCHFKRFFVNVFDENFLNEKDKALRPIILSDVIPGETKVSLKRKPIRRLSNDTDIKYGSNIVLVDLQFEDNDNEEESNNVLNEQISKIINQQKYKSKCSRHRSSKKKSKKK